MKNNVASTNTRLLKTVGDIAINVSNRLGNLNEDLDSSNSNVVKDEENKQIVYSLLTNKIRKKYKI